MVYYLIGNLIWIHYVGWYIWWSCDWKNLPNRLLWQEWPEYTCHETWMSGLMPPSFTYQCVPIVCITLCCLIQSFKFVVLFFRIPRMPMGKSSTWCTVWRMQFWICHVVRIRWFGSLILLASTWVTCQFTWQNWRQMSYKAIILKDWAWQFFTMPQSFLSLYGRYVFTSFELLIYFMRNIGWHAQIYHVLTNCIHLSAYRLQ